IGVSPFGLGEISCRDFEVIINGALLYKQNMSHLETWPPLYADEKTYVSFSWDLSDFEDKLKALLKDEDRILRISKEAQRIYEYYLYGDGRLEFCNKVMDILK
ncbi:MAG: glycosyltransferase, partial [Candidatus Omnitrophota bacterium]